MQLKPMKQPGGWKMHQAGQISVHADGSKWKKNPDNTWAQVHDQPKKAAAPAPTAGNKPKKPATYKHGQVATVGGKHFMKVGTNRYAPVKQGAGGNWHHDEKGKGIEIRKNPNGKVSYHHVKTMGHEVIRAGLHGEQQAKSGLHAQHKITPQKLQKQKHELARNPVHHVEQLKPGHIVRVKLGSTVGKEDQRKEGIVGHIKRIAGNVAHIVNDVGRTFEVPLHSLAMAKSRKDGMIELRKYPKPYIDMLKALRRE